MFSSIQTYLKRNSMENLFNSKYSFDLWLRACHINLMTQIAIQMSNEDNSINKDILYVCCMHHDDGQALQYKQFGIFNNSVSHHALGLDMLDTFLTTYNVTVTPEIQILRACMYYHGRTQLAGNSLDAQTLKYVQLVSAADEIETCCLAPVGYLPRQIANDTLCIRTAALMPSKKIRSEIWDAFKKGDLLGTEDSAHSYAEHLLFEAAKAIQCIKKYGEPAKSAMNMNCYAYPSAVAGFTSLFHQNMTCEDAKHATQILLDALK